VQAGTPGTPAVTGKGIGIAIIDSGISATHPDFQKNGHSRVVASVDFTGTGSLQSNGMTLGEGMLLGD